MAKFDLKKLSSKAKDLVDKNGDKIASSVEKVTDKIDQKTKGKYTDKLQKVDGIAHKLDKTATAGDEAGATGSVVDPVDAAAATESTTPPPVEPAPAPPANPQPFPEPS